MVVELYFKDGYGYGYDSDIDMIALDKNSNKMHRKFLARKCGTETFKIFDAILNARMPLKATDIATETKMDMKNVLKILKNDQLTQVPLFERYKNYRWSISKAGIEYIQNCKSNPSIDLSNLQQKSKKMIDIENDFNEKLKREKDMLIGKKGTEKFFTPDMSNPTDKEILFRLRNKYQKYPVGEERRCRIILAKRIQGKGISLGREKNKTDALIKSRIEIICLRQNRLWNDVVRELFCIQFNIKQSPR